MTNLIQVQEQVKAYNQENQDLLDVLDAAAFVICLDTASPTTASERCQQFLYGEPSSRWSDKTLQFVVSPNGASAYLCEHAAIDGGILAQLNQKIKNAILDHGTDRQPSTESYTNGVPVLRPLTFTSSPEIEAQTSSTQETHRTYALRTDYLFYRCNTFGGSFLRSHRCAPKSGFQIIIQLAALSYFGYNPPSWETVSMRPFHKGRVDIYQSVLPSVKDFCEAAMAAIRRSKKSEDHTSLLRPLLNTAVKAHGNLLTRVSQGRGFAAHLYALQEVIAPDESNPALFGKESIYAKTRPGKLLTDCAEWVGGIQDGGFAMPDPEFVRVHYEIDDRGCDFAIRGPEGKAGEFVAALKRAVQFVKHLLDSA